MRRLLLLVLAGLLALSSFASTVSARPVMDDEPTVVADHYWQGSPETVADHYWQGLPI